MNIDPRHLSGKFVEVYKKLRVSKVTQHMGVLLLMLMGAVGSTFSQYQLQIIPIDKSPNVIRDSFSLETSFRNQVTCIAYVNRISDILRGKGYAAASVDSIYSDSLLAKAFVYVGERFQYGSVRLDSVSQQLFNLLHIDKRFLTASTIDVASLHRAQRKILDYLENNGYPFARVELDSAVLHHSRLHGYLRTEKGPLYKIDSIRNQGTARISSNFLQHYLGIRNGAIYKKNQLQQVSQKLGELPYLQEAQPWSLTMLGTGSILNLHLLPKKSSQVNILVGLLPSNQQLEGNKMLITGEATINLRNALGNGETIGLNWQQIQVKSPRLNVIYQQSYLFNSPFGINFAFDLLKKDSSYVNISLLAGAQYSFSSSKSGSLFIQRQTSNVLTVDTLFVKNFHQLPQEADVSSVNVGLNYEVYATNYRLNPRKGNELRLSASVGTKKIKRNSIIEKLQDTRDPGFNFGSLYDSLTLSSYQFRLIVQGAHYFPLSRSSTLKAAINGGWFESPSMFRNELFQIGGYKLLRGFDEESIFAARYAVGTAEYRYLIGLNSYLFAFTDFGWSKNLNVSNTFFGAGAGMAFETKAGIFNLSCAVGKRDDTKFNLRQSKIHLGYINYF